MFPWRQILALFILFSHHSSYNQSTWVENKEMNNQITSYFGQPPPGLMPVLFAPDIFIHKEGYHSPVVFNKELTEAYWSPMERDHCIMYSLLINGEWSPPTELKLDLEQGIGDPFITSDGKKLFFLSYASIGEEKPYQERIWLSEKTKGSWGTPTSINHDISCHPTHWKCSVSEAGTIYFTSEINMDSSCQDIYFAKYLNDEYRMAKPLGNAVNTSGWEFAPCISPDESFLIFSRRDDSSRKTDLYISFRGEDGNWKTAIDLGPQINSDENDICPSLSPDGKYLFFLSTRDGISRIYWVDMAETLRSLSIKE